MTDRERIEKTYAKIKKKYPDVVNKEEIDALAIKHEKRFSLLCCLGLAAGAILCITLALLIESLSDTRYILFITGAYQIFEIFRILAKYSKIEKMYRPVEVVTHQGTLTQDCILKAGGKVLKKAGYQYVITKLPLFDKEDETEVGIDNITYHIHRLYFKVDEHGNTGFIKVNRNTYMDATIGAMYYVVLTQQNEIAAAYQASNWDLDPAVLSYCRQLEGGNDNAEPPENPQDTYQQPSYQPAPVVRTTEKEKTKKLLPILALVLIVASYFTIALIGIPMGIAALVIAIVALTQQRSKLSIASMVVTAILFVLLVLSMIAVIVG